MTCCCLIKGIPVATPGHQHCSAASNDLRHKEMLRLITAGDWPASDVILKIFTATWQC